MNMTGPRLLDRASTAIANRTSRRSFISRTALAGTALVTAPAAYVLKPGTAYAAICSCNNQRCDCSAGCCDGYTEFCCTLSGENTCPTNTVPAGWWKVDGSSFCTASGAPGPRYYLDCNAVPSGPCGSGGVTRQTNQCDCSCAEGDCGNRKACCTAFRYGQCSQAIACLGPIVCRVVTCTPPWKFDPTCTTATATDNNTRFHHRPCLDRPTPRSGGLPAAFNDGVWTLGGSFDDESVEAPMSFRFGQAGDIPVIGDWNGDGIQTVGVVRGNTWLLRDSNTSGPPQYNFVFGEPGDIPVVGDWNGDGTSGIAMVRGNRWHLRNRANAGNAGIIFTFGEVGDTPIAGDWNGSGSDGPGVHRGNRWLLSNELTSAPPAMNFAFGDVGDVPIVGDWNSNGRSGIGVVRQDMADRAIPNLWRLRQTASPGPAQITHWFTATTNDGSGVGPSLGAGLGRRPGSTLATPLTWQAASWTPGQLPS